MADVNWGEIKKTALETGRIDYAWGEQDFTTITAGKDDDNTVSFISRADEGDSKAGETSEKNSRRKPTTWNM